MSRRRASLVAALFLSLAAPSASADTVTLCAKGSARPETVGTTTQPFAQAALVRLEVDGATVRRDQLGGAAALINEVLWNAAARDVTVRVVDHQDDCPTPQQSAHLIRIEAQQAEWDAASIVTNDGTRSVSLLVVQLAAKAWLQRDSAPRTDTHLVRVLFATNRQYQRAAAKWFAGTAIAPVRRGTADVTVARDRRMSLLQAASLIGYAPNGTDTLAKFQAMTLLSADSWRLHLRRRASLVDRPGTLVFVHGYNVSFEAAMERAAQLSYDLAFSGATVAFSWPSAGASMQYLADDAAATASVSAFAAVLQEIEAEAPATPIYIVAHSMGARLAAKAVQKLVETGKGTQVTDLILAAPDIDQLEFRHEMAPRLLNQGVRVTLYASDNDVALGASALPRNARLGRSGDDIVVMPGLDTVDASTARTDFLGHSYFGDAKSVLCDLFLLINNRLPPDRRFWLAPVPATPLSYWRLRN